MEIYVSTFSIRYIGINQDNIFGDRCKKILLEILLSNLGRVKKSLLIIKENNINKLDCDFIMKPRILFNDKNLTRTDADLLSLIISLTLKKRLLLCN